MSDRDVYDGEMPRHQISDQDVERILSGREPGRDDLAPLASALSALHREAPEASDETISRLAGEAAVVARETRPEQTAGSATSGTRTGAGWRPRSLKRRLATLATAMLVFAGMSGIALAADESAPGDTLYGLDRALERIGVNDGGTAERIAETQRLTESGRIPDAMLHLADSVEEAQDDELGGSAEALRRAADSVQNDNSDPDSQAVRDAVAAMLAEIGSMEGPELDGDTFGQSVAEMARAIHDGTEDAPDDMESEGTEGAEPAPREDTGPPESPGRGEGRPDDVGPPEDPGPRDDAGKGRGPPDDTGRPENAGPPAGTPGRP